MIYKVKCFIEHTIEVEANTPEMAIEKANIVDVEKDIDVNGSDKYRFEIMGNDHNKSCVGKTCGTRNDPRILFKCIKTFASEPDDFGTDFFIGKKYFGERRCEHCYYIDSYENGTCVLMTKDEVANHFVIINELSY